MAQSTDSAKAEALFSPGQLVRHVLFSYRGVVVDLDATFQLTDEWYEQMARSRPPREQPWYHVLVHQASHMTYVAERNLAPDGSGTRIVHPMLDHFFSEFRSGRYVPDQAPN